MILVTLGTQKFKMNRLIEAIDEYAKTIEEEVFVQRGNSTYTPLYCKYENFVEREQFTKMIQNCSVLITHSGVGSIMTGLNANRPVIVVPRLAKFKEHVDDHQTQIAAAFSKKNCVLYCKDLKELPQLIDKSRTYKFSPYEAKGGKIEDIILDFISVSKSPTSMSGGE